MPPLGLYIHVPFCSAICHYCNFNRGLLDDGLKRQYVEAVIAEIRGAPARFGWPPGAARADTVFFGGGTPSLLESDEVAAILAACRDAFDVDPDAEVTLEANPESAAGPVLERIRRAGVNRLSIGAQSFRQADLVRLGRIHDVSQARRAVACARDAGFDNLSLDLMMWLPEQTLAEWLETVDAAVGLEPEHLSLYMLELYPGAPLREAMARANWSQAPDDDAADDVRGGDGQAGGGGVPPVRDFERVAARARVAPQPEVLDRRRVARVRTGRAFHAGGRPVEERRRHRRVRGARRRRPAARRPSGAT